MRTTITIYYNEVDNIHHTLVCEVSEGLPGEGEIGSHKVIHSNVGESLPYETPAHMRDSATRLVGAENVRIFRVIPI